MDGDRVTVLNHAPVNAAGRYVLYWMQQSQRAEFNPALECAIARANELERPVVVVFGLFADYPEANERHFAFMLEGLALSSRQNLRVCMTNCCLGCQLRSAWFKSVRHQPEQHELRLWLHQWA